MGVGFALLGVAFVAYGYRRLREFYAAIARGEYARPDGRVMALLAGVGVVLGLALLAIVVEGD